MLPLPDARCQMHRDHTHIKLPAVHLFGVASLRRALRARASHCGPRPPCPTGAFNASRYGMTIKAWRKMLHVLGGQYKERWPEEEYNIIFLADKFTYSQRITLLTFLYGNLRDGGLVYAAIYPQIGVDPRDHDHAQRFLADLASGKYNHKYFYFDVHAGEWLFLSGTVNLRHAPPSPLARALLAWEWECARMRRTEKRWPTLAEQRAFLGPHPY